MSLDEMLNDKKQKRKAKAAKRKPYKPRAITIRRTIPDGPYRVWTYVECGITPQGECPDILTDSYKPVSGYFATHQEAEAHIEKLQQAFGVLDSLKLSAAAGTVAGKGDADG